MIKLLGAILLAGGATALGLGEAYKLGKRANILRAMCGALSLLSRELTFRLTPMPQLLLDIGGRASPPAASFFKACARGLSENDGTRTMARLWNETLADRFPELSREDMQVLGGLGMILGRFDADGQRQAIDAARQSLERNLAQAEAEQDSRGRVYSILGLASGTFLVILFI